MTTVTAILTFDDGPHAASTGSSNYSLQALDALKTNSVQPNAKAAFFIQTAVPYRGGSDGGKNVLRRMVAEGHVVGIHTGSAEDHVSHVLRQRTGKLPDDLAGAIEYLDIELGVQDRFVRPVGGACNAQVLGTYKEAGLQIIHWDIDSLDSHLRVGVADIREQLGKEIVRQANAGATEVVVLFHELDADTRGRIEDYMAVLKQSAGDAGHAVKFAMSKQEIVRAFKRRNDEGVCR